MERRGPCPRGSSGSFSTARESLTRDEQVAFNAGSHKELVKLAWRDFARLVQPKIAAFAKK